MPRLSLCALVLFSSLSFVRAENTAAQDRAEAVRVLDRIARPVFTNLAAGTLSKNLPLGPNEEARKDFACLEAFGRALSGIAPWLELGPDDSPEGKLRAEYIALSRKALVNATAPGSPDFMNFTKGSQPLVDAAFLAQGLLRAPTQLWEPLEPGQKSDVIAALKSTRPIKPGENNWLLFSALVEAAILRFTGECEMEPITRALSRHEEWYLGDGTYGDGPSLHWDYYNSFVIHPALIEVMQVLSEKHSPLAENFPEILKRAARYAKVQESLISPEGTYPVIGRSSAYRFGAFQDLSLIALRKELPEGLDPASVRCGLAAVIRRMASAPGTFDGGGWLRVGAVGHQPSIRDRYISTGSLYLCLNGLLHLGLPADDPFWSAPPAAWTQKRIWAGEDISGSQVK